MSEPTNNHKCLSSSFTLLSARSVHDSICRSLCRLWSSPSRTEHIPLYLMCHCVKLKRFGTYLAAWGCEPWKSHGSSSAEAKPVTSICNYHQETHAVSTRRIEEVPNKCTKSSWDWLLQKDCSRMRKWLTSTEQKQRRINAGLTVIPTSHSEFRKILVCGI